MKMQREVRHYFYVALLASTAFLPGCSFIDWIKGKNEPKTGAQAVDVSNPMANISVNDSSEVLVTINGKPAVTVNSFERDFEALIDENPQLKSVLPFMPDARKNFLTGLVNQEIVDMYVQDHKLNQSAEYKQDFERLQRSIVRMLNTKYFAASNPVSVEDADVVSYYEENKDKMQELVISRGGLQTMGIQFEKEAEAQAFLNKMPGKMLADVAKTEKMADKVKDFKLVNKQSVGIDPVLRNKIVALEKTPTTEMVKVNEKAFWVVQVTSKEDAKYRSLEEVREPIRQLVEREKSNDVLQKRIEGLKQEMHVSVNTDYFKQAEAMPEHNAMPNMTAQTPEQPKQQVAAMARAA